MVAVVVRVVPALTVVGAQTLSYRAKKDGCKFKYGYAKILLAFKTHSCFLQMLSQSLDLQRERKENETHPVSVKI